MARVVLFKVDHCWVNHCAPEVFKYVLDNLSYFALTFSRPLKLLGVQLQLLSIFMQSEVKEFICIKAVDQCRQGACSEGPMSFVIVVDFGNSCLF